MFTHNLSAGRLNKLGKHFVGDTDLEILDTFWHGNSSHARRINYENFNRKVKMSRDPRQITSAFIRKKFQNFGILAQRPHQRRPETAFVPPRYEHPRHILSN